ncbi:MAG: family oxidoreductase [Phenylobacterium sp.]|nr:family oxidoreductase [Phenylobacterium sp.]
MGMLDGKVALITGGGAGIGRGVARRFVREGAAVVIAEFDVAACAGVERELTEELGGRALVLKTDVGARAQIEAAVRAGVERFGGVDILVNNAFSLAPRVLLEHKTDAILDKTLKGGLWAAWWAMRAAKPSMVARGGGSVINFYSIEVQTAAWLDADYIVNKAALLGLTRSAAHEWGRFNIRVNAIAPAAMGQAFHRMAAEIPGYAEAAADRKPLRRNGDPEADIAPVALFLASDMARFVTGELIHVDGGLHMPGYDSRPPNLADLEAQGPQIASAG